MIPTVTVLADDGTSSTQDKIFLLSETEAIKYFATDKERECNSLTMFGNSWMLRSIDDFFTNSVLAVESDGSISPNNSYSFAEGVRPAMWIEIN